MGDAFKMDMQDDSWYVNDDIMMINRDLVNVAKWELNRNAAGIDAKKDKIEETQVRFSTDPLLGNNMITLVYENKSSAPGGLMNKKSLMKAIELEHAMLLFDAKGANFKNKKFNG
jgi:hypothetical protein